MTDPVILSDAELKALREQAIIDLVSVVCTTMEMVEAGHDCTPWIVENTANWTGDHGRQAVLLVGMLASGANLNGDDVAAMGKLLLGD